MRHRSASESVPAPKRIRDGLERFTGVSLNEHRRIEVEGWSECRFATLHNRYRTVGRNGVGCSRMRFGAGTLSDASRHVETLDDHDFDAPRRTTRRFRNPMRPLRRSRAHLFRPNSRESLHGERGKVEVHRGVTITVVERRGATTHRCITLHRRRGRIAPSPRDALRTVFSPLGRLYGTDCEVSQNDTPVAVQPRSADIRSSHHLTPVDRLSRV